VRAVVTVATTRGSTDGRVARGERTRRALAEAMIALLEDGDPQPTARRIAEHAGVSLRLVFHHFDDLESILRAAVEVQAERHWSHLRPVPATGATTDRIRRIVRQRTEVYDAVTPVRRSAQLVERTSPTVARELAHVRSRLRDQLRASFGPELAAGGAPAGRHLLDAVEVALSWETWEQLRRLGRSPAACRRTMELLAGSLLVHPTAGASGTPPPAPGPPTCGETP